LPLVGGNLYFGSTDSNDYDLPDIAFVPASGGTAATYVDMQESAYALLSDGVTLYRFQEVDLDESTFCVESATPPDSTFTAATVCLSYALATFQVGPAGGYMGGLTVAPPTDVAEFSVVSATVSAYVSNASSWSFAARGVVFDRSGVGLELDGLGTVPVMSNGAVTALGGFTQLAYDPDGYVYFIDANLEIGRILLR
jgi:hypothetical protein